MPGLWRHSCEGSRGSDCRKVFGQNRLGSNFGALGCRLLRHAGRDGHAKLRFIAATPPTVKKAMGGGNPHGQVPAHPKP